VAANFEVSSSRRGETGVNVKRKVLSNTTQQVERDGRLGDLVGLEQVVKYYRMKGKKVEK
jgi:hypothetical protein